VPSVHDQRLRRGIPERCPIIPGVTTTQNPAIDDHLEAGRMGLLRFGPRDQRGQAPAWLRYWQKAAGAQTVSGVAPATSEARLPWTPSAPRWQHGIGKKNAVRPMTS